MVELISRIGGLFGRDPKKKAVAAKSPKKRSSVSKGPSKKPIRAAKAHKPAAKAKQVKPAAKKAIKVAPVTKVQTKKQPAELSRSLVLFVKPNCADCDDAKKLLPSVRRVVHNVVFREVDVSTKEGEIEGLLNGVVQTPAFVINGRLVFRGVLPSREQLARVVNEGVSQ